MDPEAKMRRQSRRVIISEVIMVLSVIMMVVILAFLASGYWLNSDFKVERQGMLQISSAPTGADVEVDGEAPWFQRTNTSKVLSSGEHYIKLTKDGYDTWSKKITISEGLLYRIYYPRLFLLEREKSEAYDLAGTTLATISPARDKMLITNSSTSWSILPLEDDKITAKTIDISKFFTVSNSGAFAGTILAADWDASGSHILFKVQQEGFIEWILMDVNNAKNSINLTKEFATNFSEVEILDDSSNNLLVVLSGNLCKVDVSARQISAPLVLNVESYDHLGSEVIYSSVTNAKTSTEADAEAPTHKIGLLHIGDNKTEVLTTANEPVKVLISRFYDKKYLTILQGEQISIYEKDDFKKVIEKEISFVPVSAKVGHDGDFFILTSGQNIATIDMESEDLTEWQLDSSHYGWLNDDMIYTVKDGLLTVYDYDGQNRRELANNVSSRYPVSISNNKWLYYTSDNMLIREVIAD